MDQRIACLAHRHDAATTNANVGFDDAPVIENDRVGNDQIEWRFRKAVFDSFERARPGATSPPTEMERIVFPDVYPLYAIADIRGSSTQRSWAIQSDLLAQLGLARDVLRTIMKLTRPESGQIAYSYTGNGLLTGALIHNEPSDLDLFFLLAMTEYLAVTGDEDFLHENVSFYPADPQPEDQTVLHHMQVAFDHLGRSA